MNEALKILKETRKLLINKGWTQGSYARDRYGQPAFVNSEYAATFCMLGSFAHVCKSKKEGSPYEVLFVDDAGYTGYSSALRMLRKVVYENSGLTIRDFNDFPGRTKTECLEMYDKAIVLAAQE